MVKISTTKANKVIAKETNESKLTEGKTRAKKTEKKVLKQVDANKYVQLTGKKRKLEEDGAEEEANIKATPAKKSKQKSRLEPDANQKFKNDKASAKNNFNNDNKSKVLKKIAKSGSPNNKKEETSDTQLNKKQLKEKRKKTKLAENYEMTVQMKKIWETLRRFGIFAFDTLLAF
jgi:hypothetical protein